MKERSFYTTPDASWFMRFLWKAAGGDKYLLEQATYSDQVKYMCLGGVVFATGAMAGLAGGYAFYTIFSPRGSAIDDSFSIPVCLASIAFGIVWGLIIFNLDRFIVTSTGKGDGTEKITWDELKGAIPRIIMGAIIAITISKPIEIRMFQTEINAALHEEQLSLQKDYERRTRKNFEDRIKDLEKENTVVQSKIDDYQYRINTKDSLYDVEMTRGNGDRGPGEGTIAKALLRERNKLETDLAAFRVTNKTKIDELELSRKKIYAELDVALSQNQKVSSGLDGLLERIKLSHKIAGFWISLFVTLLFMAIELTPVFFKLMLTKTTYDYLAENRDELIKAEYGIEVRYDYYKDQLGMERHLTINHEADKLMYEKIKVSEIQKELTDYAIARYKEREKQNIDDNLDQYITKITTDADS